MWPPTTTEVAGRLPGGWSRRQQLALGVVLVLLLLAAISEWWRRQPKSVFPGQLTSTAPGFVAGVETGGGSVASGDRVLLDVNRARVGELSALPGIGPTIAQRIVAYREEHGPFRRMEDLRRVPGVGPKTWEKLSRYVCVVETASATPAVSVNSHSAATARPAASTSGSARPATSAKKLPDTPVDINRASREELIRLPGIGAVLADRILADRQANGPYQRIEDLTRIRGIKGRTLEKLRPYVRVGAEPTVEVRSLD